MKIYSMLFITCLIIFITAGCEKDNENANNLTPEAEFSASSTNVKMGDKIDFKDLTSNEPVEWEWDFGDDSISKEQNPSHTYHEMGEYTVTLKVTNEFGTDTEIKEGFIRIDHILPNISYYGTLFIHPTDNSSSEKWYNEIYSKTTGATSTTDGESNTNLIVANHGTGSYAAYICDTLSTYGYNDWYLPAKDELNAIYNNKELIGGFSSVENWSSGGYWSSTEKESDAAWVQIFADGMQYDDTKDFYCRVRCVRRD
jgi:PKD repeat protein